MSPPSAPRWPPLGLRFVAFVAGLGLGGLPGPAARAHEALAGYVQQRVSVLLDARHVDVTVHLTFFEEGSEHERVHMDADGDGRLSRAETEAYLKQLAPGLAGSVKLRAAGQAVDLVPLREPELDLLGWTGTGRWHHRLSLFFFAPVPADLAPGTELVVENRLWPERHAVGLLQVEGRDGARLEAVPLPDSLFPPARKGEAREFRARVISPPQAGAATPATVQRKP